VQALQGAFLLLLTRLLLFGLLLLLHRCLSLLLLSSLVFLLWLGLRLSPLLPLLLLLVVLHLVLCGTVYGKGRHGV
jgi:hypothetical protein